MDAKTLGQRETVQKFLAVLDPDEAWRVVVNPFLNTLGRFYAKDRTQMVSACGSFLVRPPHQLAAVVLRGFYKALLIVATQDKDAEVRDQAYAVLDKLADHINDVFQEGTNTTPTPNQKGTSP